MNPNHDGLAFLGESETRKSNKLGDGRIKPFLLAQRATLADMILGKTVPLRSRRQ